MLNPHDALVRKFADACQRGDIAALRDALEDDAVAVCDDGGLLSIATGPVWGAEDVAQLAAVLLGERPDTELAIEAVNGGDGLALRRNGEAVAVVAIAVGVRIAVIWIVLNPAKLGGWHRR
jgi:hypothetical protein